VPRLRVRRDICAVSVCLLDLDRGSFTAVLKKYCTCDVMKYTSGVKVNRPRW
jgi:hypothetical protein